MKKIQIILLSISLLMMGCKKQQDWLDEKVNLNSVVPSRLKDFQALLDGDALFQGYGVMGLVGSDRFYVTDADFNAVSIGFERNTYQWAKEVYEGYMPQEWNTSYRMIAIANICLEGLQKIPLTAQNETEWKQVQGAAHFYRAMGYYLLLQFFAPQYNTLTADKDLGVPIRMTADVNERPGRSSVKACYDQLFADLKIAIPLLPDQVSIKTRPSKLAALGLMARTNLIVGNWQQATMYAAELLSKEQTLVDFNTLNAAATLPFPSLQNKHPEVIFYAESSISNYYLSNRPIFDSLIYRSYAPNDLRKTVFFRLFNNQPIFKGFYTGVNLNPFAGIARNEIFLIRAESLARMGELNNALATINTLLAKRWKTGTYIPLTATNAGEALQKIITERSKELPFTGNLVWEDLRRLNTDQRFARTLKKTVNGTTYVLPPNDSKYVMPIPDVEIRLTGIPQNPRL